MVDAVHARSARCDRIATPVRVERVMRELVKAGVPQADDRVVARHRHDIPLGYPLILGHPRAG